MKKPFKVGDKIKFVGPATDFGRVAAWAMSPETAVVTFVEGAELRIRLLSTRDCGIHQRQVTHRLVKKAKR